MSKIIGNTTATPMAVPDWEQKDPRKADYIKNKPDFDGLSEQVENVDEKVDGLESYVDNQLNNLITVDEIDEICGAKIYSASEVEF